MFGSKQLDEHVQAPREVPPLDLVVPESLETATFANG
jgi:hypothetical protein